MVQPNDMMAQEQPAPFVAVDVGNSSMHFGIFDGTTGATTPQPSATFACEAADEEVDGLESWLNDQAVHVDLWQIASVNERATQRLAAWLRRQNPAARVHAVSHEHLPLAVEVDHPDRVGIDRLLAAVAVNRLREDGRAAVVVDAGTAITVDCVAASGAFVGGSILPGMRLWARALDQYTEKLPLIDTSSLDCPPAVGRNTQAAMQSGIYWGVRGAVEELIRQASKTLGGQPQIFITGGDAVRLNLTGGKLVPHLVLSGIALAAAAGARLAAGEIEARP